MRRQWHNSREASAPLLAGREETTETGLECCDFWESFLTRKTLLKPSKAAAPGTVSPFGRFYHRGKKTQTKSANLLFRRRLRRAAGRPPAEIFITFTVWWLRKLRIWPNVLDMNILSWFLPSAATYSLVSTRPLGAARPTNPAQSALYQAFLLVFCRFGRPMRFRCWGGSLTVNWLVISHDFISQLSHWYKPVTFHRNSCLGYDTGFYFSLLTPLNTLCTCKSELMDLSSSSFSGSWPHEVQPHLSSTPH